VVFAYGGGYDDTHFKYERMAYGGYTKYIQMDTGLPYKMFMRDYNKFNVAKGREVGFVFPGSNRECFNSLKKGG